MKGEHGETVVFFKSSGTFSLHGIYIGCSSSVSIIHALLMVMSIATARSSSRQHSLGGGDGGREVREVVDIACDVPNQDQRAYMFPS